MTISTFAAFIFGVVIEAIVFLIVSVMRKLRPDGVLKIDYANPEKDVYMLEVNRPLDTIHMKRYLIFKVVIDE